MENSETLDFGELSGDSAFKERVESFQSRLKNVEKIIDTILEKDVYNNLSNEDKVRLVTCMFFISEIFTSDLRLDFSQS